MHVICRFKNEKYNINTSTKTSFTEKKQLYDYIRGFRCNKFSLKGNVIVLMEPSGNEYHLTFIFDEPTSTGVDMNMNTVLNECLFARPK